MVERDGDVEPLPDDATHPQHVVPVPTDDNLSGYLLPESLLDPSAEQDFAAPELPTTAEVRSTLANVQSVAEMKTPDNARLVSAFQSVIELMTCVDRKLFAQPYFGQTPFERLVHRAGISEMIRDELHGAHRQLSRLCSKNPEMVTSRFFQTVAYYLQRIAVPKPVANAEATEERQPEIVVLEDVTLQSTEKLVAELGLDCWLAADRFIISGGFPATLPPLESPPPRTDENDQPLPLTEFSDGCDFLDAKFARRAYMIRRDAPDAPKIDLGEVYSRVTRDDMERVASLLRQVAISELLLVRNSGVELATSLALARKRANHYRDQLLPFESLRSVMGALAAKLQVAGIWQSLDGVARKAFVRLRNQKITAVARDISDASVDQARAAYDRAEKIRFKAAELMAKNEHPDIKYVDDVLLKETAAYRIATGLFDEGQIRETLEAAVQADFDIEPPTFADGVVPPPEDDAEII